VWWVVPDAGLNLAMRSCNVYIFLIIFRMKLQIAHVEGWMR
jgi:hypothetical protein